jgi:hypothetical protein
MAWRKDDAADPVGRGRGVADPPLPPPPPPGRRPDDAVNPCFLRHCWTVELCDVLEPEPEPDDTDELEPHPATATSAVNATVPSTARLAAARLWDRRIKYCLPRY